MSALHRDGSLLRCPCGRKYPIVGGIPIVLSDLEGWAASEGADALRDPGISGEVVELLALDEASLRNRRLLDVYAAAENFSPFEQWISALVPTCVAPVLEVGAGVGHAGTLRLDLNLALLRAGPPPPALVDLGEGVAVAPGGAVVGDAADPPFEAGAFQSVILANVLDSCRDPFLVLAQADAMVAAGGSLVVACAFAFDPSITPRASWFDEVALGQALSGLRPFGGYSLVCRLEGEALELEWRLPISSRTAHVHSVRVLVARRPS